MLYRSHYLSAELNKYNVMFLDVGYNLTRYDSVQNWLLNKLLTWLDHAEVEYMLLGVGGYHNVVTLRHKICVLFKTVI